MWTVQKIIVILTGIIGVLLVAAGIAGGVWPLSWQLIAGILLVLMAVLRGRIVFF